MQLNLFYFCKPFLNKIIVIFVPVPIAPVLCIYSGLHMDYSVWFLGVLCYCGPMEMNEHKHFNFKTTHIFLQMNSGDVMKDYIFQFFTHFHQDLGWLHTCIHSDTSLSSLACLYSQCNLVQPGLLICEQKSSSWLHLHPG